MRISGYQIDDLGIENESYFQGYGVSFTSFSDCAVGIGDDPAEALDDCLEAIAQQGLDVTELERMILADFPDFKNAKLNKANSVGDWIKRNGGDSESESELHYYIGIRWNCAVSA